MGQGQIISSAGHDRVVAVLRENASSLLRIAHAHSLCTDDAHDAYQRALEIFLNRLDRIEDATAGSWLRTVVKHEALAIRESRQRTLPREEVDFDGYVSVEAREADERAESFDRVARSAEALRTCKQDEVTALFLSAEGNTYAQICEITGWTNTKVNRCLTEGRARFLSAFSDIDSGAACERWAPVLSAIVDGEAAAEDVAAVRPHLRNCPGCRATLRDLYESRPVLGALLPAGLLAAGAGGAADTPGLLARAYEAVAHAVGERVTASALKIQAAADALSTGKVAAVAASAAALAGGGVAVERAVLEPQRDTAAPLAAAAAADRTQPTASEREATAGSRVVATAPAADPAPAQPRSRSTATQAGTRSRKATREFSFESRSKRAQHSAAPAASAQTATRQQAPAPKPRSSGAEFGFEQ